ncbi:MAG: pyrroline-5-carboxylate reductase family protein, partial [bacterium]
MKTSHLAVLGAGNIGRAMALGLAAAGRFQPRDVILTRRHADALDDLAQQGFRTTSDNGEAVRAADVVVVAVAPQQLDQVLQEIAGDLDPERHVLVSVVSGAAISAIRERIGKDLPIVRAMPNTAIALGQSMT